MCCLSDAEDMTSLQVAPGLVLDQVWERFDPRVFLRGSAPVTKVQAAFRSAYGLPRVDAVAVGTDNVDHLRELTEPWRAR